LLDRGQHQTQAFCHFAQHSEIERATVAERLRPQIDLRDAGIFRKELPVGEVRAEYQQGVAALHGVIPGSESHQSCHADIEGIVVFDVLLAAQGMYDGCFQFGRECDHLLVGPRTTGSAKQGDPRTPIQKICQRRDLGIRRTNERPRGLEPGGYFGGDALQRDIAGNDYHGDSTFGDRHADGPRHDLRQQFSVGYQFDVVAAVLEEAFRMRRLKIIDADFRTRDVRGDGEHGNAAALAVEESVDEVQIAGTAAAGTDGEFTRQMRFSPRREGRALFVAHVYPLDRLEPPQGIGEAVERVAHDAINALDADLRQPLRHVFRSRCSHWNSLEVINRSENRISPC
jgi:hypothetical protein